MELEKLTTLLETPGVPLPVIGAMVKLHMHTQIAVSDVPEVDLQAYRSLVGMGFAKHLDGTFTLCSKAEEEEEGEWKDLWAKFFSLYPGMKRDIRSGGKRELDLLKVRHKKVERVMADVLEGLEVQIAQRELIKRENEVRKARGERPRFLPEWPHMQTYLRQGRWTERFDVQGIEVPEEEEYDGDYKRYRDSLKALADYHQVVLVPSMYLSLDEYTNNRIGYGIFKGSQYVMAEERLRSNLTKLHAEYITQQFLRKDYVSVFEYIKVWWKEQKLK